MYFRFIYSVCLVCSQKFCRNIPKDATNEIIWQMKHNLDDWCYNFTIRITLLLCLIPSLAVHGPKVPPKNSTLCHLIAAARHNLGLFVIFGLKINVELFNAVFSLLPFLKEPSFLKITNLCGMLQKWGKRLV